MKKSIKQPFAQFVMQFYTQPTKRSFEASTHGSSLRSRGRSQFAAGALMTVLVAVTPMATAAPWQLDAEASTLGFASVKNDRIAEGHRFTNLSGTVDAQSSELIIDLSSVDTEIPIRDERMREMLFDVLQFPNAVFESDLGSDALEGIEAGESRSVEIRGELSLRDARIPVTATVLVTRTGADHVIVSTQRPIVVSAAALALSDGLERLREIAGLQSITPSVPVTFTLSFARETPPERRSF